jgi:hypothetical protein
MAATPASILFLPASCTVSEKLDVIPIFVPLLGKVLLPLWLLLRFLQFECEMPSVRLNLLFIFVFILLCSLDLCLCLTVIWGGSKSLLSHFFLFPPH